MENVHRYDKKALGIAIGVEAGVIASAGFAGVEFAYKYAGEAPQERVAQVAALSDYVPSIDWAGMATNFPFWMAIVGTVLICVAETARVPLALAFRRQRNWALKIAMLVGVIAMCLVTTKSVSQVMEQMFHPRLKFVQEANVKLHEAEGVLAKLESDRSNKQAPVDAKGVQLEAIDKQISELNESLKIYGSIPKAQSVCRSVKSKQGRWTKSCHLVQPAWAGAGAQSQRDQLLAQRQSLLAEQGDLTQTVSATNTEIADANQHIVEAKDAKIRAVGESQLHSFTAMVFGKDPAEVTDAEVHWFLRFFVFLPALMIAFASTLLAMGAVYMPRKPKAKKVDKSLSLNMATMVPTLDGIVRTMVASHLNQKAA